jgi:hypothetical protein
MAIATNDTIDKFGTRDEVTSAPATVANAGYSTLADTGIWLNDDDAPFALFTLQLTAAGLGGAPTAGSVIDLFTQLQDITDSTDDAILPKANFEHYYLGSFPVTDADEDQSIPIGPIRLPNMVTSQGHVFTIKNNCGQALGTSWQLFVTPMTYGPAA